MERHPHCSTAQAHPHQSFQSKVYQGDQMAQNRTYTTEQIAVVARELREAAGAQEERFTGDQVVDLLDGEIRTLRQRGFTDDRITSLLAGFDVELKKNQIERRSRAPGSLLRRLLWDRYRASQWQFEELPRIPHASR